ncbi:MAG: DUF4340 domain-containing protein [Deltaproteobacteria bacterium]|nr:DUF4340 domain-containing protein [Deltaproteobacteria bacterium]
MAASKNLRTTAALGAMVLVGTGILLWSNRRVPDIVRDERHARVFSALRRDQIQSIVVDRGREQFECVKEGGRWHVTVAGRRVDADETEVERLLSEAEFLQPIRQLGTLDHYARTRFGLAAPRARVTLRESSNGARLNFAIGSIIEDERAVYVEYEGRGFVVSRTIADTYLVLGRDLRARTLVETELDRITAIELEAPGMTTIRAEKSQGFFRLTGGDRVSRSAIESLLGDMRELRATRFVDDDPSPARLAEMGLQPPRRTVRVVRTGRPPIVLHYGAVCPGHADEVLVRRDDVRAVACVPQQSYDNASRTLEQLRDDRLIYARTDEIERVTLHGSAGNSLLIRAAEGWRSEGVLAGSVDTESAQQWLDALTALRVESRVAASEASARGITPASSWIEIARTGIEATERVELGQRNEDHAWVRRAGEPSVLALAPTAEELLRADGSRFRSRSIIRDVPEELTSLITDGPGFRDEVQRIDGNWRVVHPFAAAADPLTLRGISERIASLDALRWSAPSALPEHGLTTPRGRITARFEGPGASLELGDAGPPARVREHQLLLGASAVDGSVYAQLLGNSAVFLMSQSVADELLQPHLDHSVLSLDPTEVTRVTCTARGGPTLRLRRDPAGWRTESNAAFDRAAVEALLESLRTVRAPRVWGYGPSSASAGIGAHAITITLGLTDAASREIQLEIGSEFAGSPAGVYARIRGVDATLSVSEETARAVAQCGRSPVAP